MSRAGVAGSCFDAAGSSALRVVSSAQIDDEDAGIASGIEPLTSDAALSSESILRGSKSVGAVAMLDILASAGGATTVAIVCWSNVTVGVIVCNEDISWEI